MRLEGAPRILPVNAEAPDPAAVTAAAAALGRGELVAFPTDTLYALAADPFRPAALDRVYAAKGRTEAKVVSLLVTGPAMAARLAEVVPPAARAFMARFWPGPLTIIVPAAPGLPEGLVSEEGGVGLRAPGGALARAILDAVGGPLVGTSANRTGGSEPRDAATALEAVGPALALLLDGGPTPLGAPSSVVDCLTVPPRILRAGAVAPAELAAAWPGCG